MPSEDEHKILRAFANGRAKECTCLPPHLHASFAQLVADGSKSHDPETRRRWALRLRHLAAMSRAREVSVASEMFRGQFDDVRRVAAKHILAVVASQPASIDGSLKTDVLNYSMELAQDDASFLPYLSRIADVGVPAAQLVRSKLLSRDATSVMHAAKCIAFLRGVDPALEELLVQVSAAWLRKRYSGEEAETSARLHLAKGLLWAAKERTLAEDLLRQVCSRSNTPCFVAHAEYLLRDRWQDRC